MSLHSWDEMRKINNKTSPEVVEEMFKWWCDNACQDTALAKQFKIARQTIHNIKKREKWIERFKQIRTKLQVKTDQAVVKTLSKNLEYVTAVKTKLLLTLLDKAKPLDGSIGELVKLMEYEDHLLGLSPDEKTRPSQIIFNIINGMTINERDELDTNLEIFYGNGNRPAPPERLSKVAGESEGKPRPILSSDSQGNEAKV